MKLKKPSSILVPYEYSMKSTALNNSYTVIKDDNVNNNTLGNFKFRVGVGVGVGVWCRC